MSLTWYGSVIQVSYYTMSPEVQARSRRSFQPSGTIQIGWLAGQLQTLKTSLRLWDPNLGFPKQALVEI